MGQRLDIVLQLPPGTVSLPILALREGSEEQTGVILATATATISKVATKASSAGPVLDLSLEAMLKAASPLDERPATKTYPLILSGSMTGYSWGISVCGVHAPWIFRLQRSDGNIGRRVSSPNSTWRAHCEALIRAA
jgi:hypothetical protein